VLSQEVEKLVLDNQKLVYFLAQKFLNQGIEQEDLYSIGNYALLKAAKDFSSEKEIRFSTFAGTCIENEIKKELRKFKTKKRSAVVISIDREIALKNQKGDAVLFSNFVSDPNVDIEKEVFNALEIQRLLAFTLNRKCKCKRAYLLYAADFTQHEIANMLGISQAQVSRYIARHEREIILYSEKEENIEKEWDIVVEQNEYMLIFATRRVDDFKRVLPKLIESENPIEFKFTVSHEKAVITLPRDKRGITFLAIFMNEIEEYNVKLSKIQTKVEEKVSRKGVEKENGEDESEDLDGSEDSKKVKRKKLSCIREYMKEKRSFSTGEILQKFPDYSKSSIYTIVYNLKKDGIIKDGDGKGKYIWLTEKSEE